MTVLCFRVLGLEGSQYATLCLVQLPRAARVILCNTVSSCLLAFVFFVLFCFDHFLGVTLVGSDWVSVTKTWVFIVLKKIQTIPPNTIFSITVQQWIPPDGIHYLGQVGLEPVSVSPVAYAFQVSENRSVPPHVTSCSFEGFALCEKIGVEIKTFTELWCWIWHLGGYSDFSLSSHAWVIDAQNRIASTRVPAGTFVILWESVMSIL